LLHSKIIGRLFITLTFPLCSLALSAGAQKEDSPLDSLRVENYQLKERLNFLEARREAFRWGRFTEGAVLRSGSVMHSELTPEGRLAFATDRQGVIFFDGTVFEIVNSRFSGLQDDFVTSLAPLDGNRAYLATGSGLVFYDQGTVTRCENIPAELETAPVSCLAAQGEKDLWVGTQGMGLWHLSGDRWENFQADTDSTGLSNNDINSLVVEPNTETVWVGTAGGGVYRLGPQGWQRFEEPLGPGSSEVYCLTLDADGLIWIGTVSAGAGFWDGIAWRKAPLPLEENEGVVNIAVLSDGDLFFGSTAGSFIYDRAAGLWQRLPVPEELAPYPIISACEACDHLWLSPSGQGLYLYDRGVIERYSQEQGLPSNIVYHIAQAEDNRIWCATWNGVGIFDGRRWKRMGRGDGLPSDLVNFVLFGKEDKACFGTHSGVAILSAGQWTVYDRDNGLTSNTINHLSLDSRNRLWISTEGGGLGVLEGDSLKIFSASDGLPSNQVQAAANEPNGTVWVATKRGLACIEQGRVFPVAEDQSSPGSRPGPYHFTALEVTADGSLWAATYGQGVWRKNAQDQWRQFTVDNGLNSNEVYAIASSRDGRLFFGTTMGLSLYDGKYWRSYGPADGLISGAVKSITPATDGALWLASEDQGIVRFDLTRFQPPETYIRTPEGLLVCQNVKNRLVQLVAAQDKNSAPAQADTAGGVFYLENQYYFALPGPAVVDTLSASRLELSALAMTPWWPETAKQFRYSYKLDNNPWTDFSYQGTIGFHGLERGMHVINVRAKGPHLRVDPTAAIYRFYVDIPTLWSDWRTYALALILLSGIFAVIFRKQLTWYLGKLRHRHFRPLTPNPFNPNVPVREKERFFGREETLKALSESFTSGHVSLIIHGEEKIGVTSLLTQAADHVKQQGAKALYLDLARLYFQDVKAFIKHLSLLLANETPPAPDLDKQADVSLEDFRELVGQEQSPVLFFFDNAELFGRLILRDEKSGSELASCFRELLLSDNGASFVFGLKALNLFREQVEVLFDVSRIIRVGEVTREAAKAIITKPLAGRALLHDDALDLLVSLAGGHPYLLYCLGQELVEQVNRERTNLCTEGLVSRTVESLLKNPPVLLVDCWDELTKREKLLLAAAVSVSFSSEKPVILSLSDIVGILSSHRISLLEEELAKASADLSHRELLLTEDGGARIRVEDSLLNRWICANQNIDLINALEEYDLGEAMRKLGDELAHSFKMDELARRILSFLDGLLHFEWGALLAAQSKKGEGEQIPLTQLGTAGSGAHGIKLPESLSARMLERLSLKGGALTVEGQAPGEDSTDQPWPFQPGTLLVPMMTRGTFAGLLALSRRRDGERYSRRDRLFVETIAEQVAVSMENVRLYEEETEKERLKQELETARKMQMAILPERKPQLPDLDIYAYLNPATEVGGDYFDYIQVDGSKLLFIIADVSGHGISASTLVYMAKSCIFNQIKTDYSVEKVMAAMNDMVYGVLKERLLMTFCYAIFDLEKRTLSYSIAGHPFPYHYHAREGKLKELELSAYPLGVTPKAKYKSVEISYQPGDLFAFYSDGIIEGSNPGGEQFGFLRFEQIILDNKDLDAEGINRNMIDSFHVFSKGNPQDDDVTLVTIKAQ